MPGLCFDPGFSPSIWNNTVYNNFMIEIQENLSVQDLLPDFPEFWEASGKKLLAVQKEFNFDNGSPVFTVKGKYTTRGWTDWTLSLIHI